MSTHHLLAPITCPCSWNSQRALGLSWWKEAGKFALLTVGLLMLGRFVFTNTMQVSECTQVPMHCTHQCLLQTIGTGSSDWQQAFFLHM
jgi:hypothetical protein